MAKFGEPGAPKRGPGGRPKADFAMREEARKHGPAAIKGLLAIAEGKGKGIPWAVRRAAWVDIIERGFGKPTVGEPDDQGRQVERVVYSWGDSTE